ncbi:hypothetical protein, partial [Microcoleus sp.]|uniref:hypothetical protein n=1 Tax=Microcoleus sp. TaxID=44472 RepID=UPI00403E8CBA
MISTPLASSGVKSNQQSILNYHSVFRPLLQQSTVNSQQSTIIPVQLESRWQSVPCHLSYKTVLA